MTENYASGTTLNNDLRRMLELRKSVLIDEVSDSMKKLWRWYALDLLVKVSRSSWDWKQADMRNSKYLSKCVSVGDEAIVLTVLKLRAQDYFDSRSVNHVTPPKRGGRGRQRGMKPDPEKGLIENFDKYLEFRQVVESIRRAEGSDDTFGWNKYICDESNKETIGSTISKRSRKKRRSIYDDLDLPMESI